MKVELVHNDKNEIFLQLIINIQNTEKILLCW